MSRAPATSLDEIVAREFDRFWKEIEAAFPPRKDKRREIRVPCGLTVPYQIYQDNAWVAGRSALLSLNLSGSGIKLLLSKALVAGQYLHLEIPIDPTIPVAVMGRLQWIVPSELAGYHLAGVAFVKLDPRIRRILQHYVEHLKQAHVRRYFEIKDLEGKERRRFFRLPKRFRLTYQLYTKERWVRGCGEMLTLNVGGGGIQILTTEALVKGGTVSVALPLDGEELPLSGKVQWVRQMEPHNQCLAGIEFLNLTDDNRDKILRYLFKEELRERNRVKT